jgi:hypothetical protein
MRKVIVSTFLTLDGVMQAPGDPDEDRAGGSALSTVDGRCRTSTRRRGLPSSKEWRRPRRGS